MTTSATLTMLVTDAVASTSFRHTQGDAPAHQRMAKIESVVTEVVKGRGGRVVKNTGDGQLVVFESARSAVSAAMEIQRDVHALNSRRSHRRDLHSSGHTHRRGDH
jgi:adenylate cyclase